MTVLCNSCHRAFEDYRALAVHISTSKLGHRKGKAWAAKFLLRDVVLKKEMPERVPLTEEQKESRKSTVREVSGRNKTIQAFCPKCKRTHMVEVPEEFTDSEYAWKVQGKLAILCLNCGRVK